MMTKMVLNGGNQSVPINVSYCSNKSCNSISGNEQGSIESFDNCVSLAKPSHHCINSQSASLVGHIPLHQYINGAIEFRLQT